MNHDTHDFWTRRKENVCIFAELTSWLLWVAGVRESWFLCRWRGSEREVGWRAAPVQQAETLALEAHGIAMEAGEKQQAAKFVDEILGLLKPGAAANYRARSCPGRS